MRLIAAVCVAAFLTVYGIAVTVAYLSASSAEQHAQAKLDAAVLLQDQAAAARIPVPSLRTVQAYGAPYNVTITCTVAGSSEATAGRVPLDPDGAPRPGDLYVKTCRATS